MLEWLKTILGDTYTEDIDKKVSEEIGKQFVSRADFNTLNKKRKPELTDFLEFLYYPNRILFTIPSSLSCLPEQGESIPLRASA